MPYRVPEIPYSKKGGMVVIPPFALKNIPLFFRNFEIEIYNILIFATAGCECSGE